MSLRIRMMITKQIENLLRMLDEAENEILPAVDYFRYLVEKNNNIKNRNNYYKLIGIYGNIKIAKNRINEFETKSIKEFEKLHKEKLKRLKTTRKQIAIEKKSGAW